MAAVKCQVTGSSTAAGSPVGSAVVCVALRRSLAGRPFLSVVEVQWRSRLRACVSVSDCPTVAWTVPLQHAAWRWVDRTATAIELSAFAHSGGECEPPGRSRRRGQRAKAQKVKDGAGPCRRAVARSCRFGPCWRAWPMCSRRAAWKPRGRGVAHGTFRLASISNRGGHTGLQAARIDAMAEPSDGESATTIRVRLPSGSTLQRRFAPDELVDVVYVLCSPPRRLQTRRSPHSAAAHCGSVSGLNWLARADTLGSKARAMWSMRNGRCRPIFHGRPSPIGV